jgi:hypothetical protein
MLLVPSIWSWNDTFPANCIALRPPMIVSLPSIVPRVGAWKSGASCSTSFVLTLVNRTSVS